MSLFFESSNWFVFLRSDCTLIKHTTARLQINFKTKTIEVRTHGRGRYLFASHYKNVSLYTFLVAIPHFMAHAMAKKERKRRRKNNKNYSAELLHNAVSSGWEDHEVAKLIVLVSGSLEFSNKKLLRFLKKTTLMSPGVIACLQDSGIKIKADSVVTSLLDSAASPDRVSRIFAEGFECGIISTDDPAVIIAVGVVIIHSHQTIIFLVTGS